MIEIKSSTLISALRSYIYIYLFNYSLTLKFQLYGATTITLDSNFFWLVLVGLETLFMPRGTLFLATHATSILSYTIKYEIMGFGLNLFKAQRPKFNTITRIEMYFQESLYFRIGFIADNLSISWDGLMAHIFSTFRCGFTTNAFAASRNGLNPI